MKNNPLTYFVGGAVICAVLLGFVARDGLPGKPAAVETAETKNQPAQQQAAIEPKAEPEPAKSLVKPTFDVVTVAPDGLAVIAGRAAPRAQIKVMLGANSIGEAIANDAGEWILPTEPTLPPGAHNLTVVATTEDGESQQSDQTLAVAVAEKPEQQPLIVLSEPTQPSKVLQKPDPVPQQTAEAEPVPQQTAKAEPEPTAEAEPEATEPVSEQTVAALDTTNTQASQETKLAPTPMPTVKVDPEPEPETVAKTVPAPTLVAKVPLTLDTVDYNDTGDIIFSGKSNPDGKVRIYVDNQHVGDAKADAGGMWLFKGNEEITSGLHQLRIDQLKSDGEVVQRRELPFERADPSKVAELQAAQSATNETQPAKPAKSSEPKQDTASVAATSKTAEPAPSETAEPSASETSAPVTSETAEPATSETAELATSETATSETAEPATSKTAEPATSETAGSTVSGETQTAAAPAEEPQEPTVADETKIAAVTPGAETATPEKTQPAKAVPGKIVIQPGNNLWNISRVIYGRGIEYTTIYEANKDQIRNPHRIYPGQIFTTPGAAPPEEIDPDWREPLSADEKQTQ